MVGTGGTKGGLGGLRELQRPRIQRIAWLVGFGGEEVKDGNGCKMAADREIQYVDAVSQFGFIQQQEGYGRRED